MNEQITNILNQRITKTTKIQQLLLLVTQAARLQTL